MNDMRPLHSSVVVFGLFTVSFLPRVLYPVARSTVWHDRAILFFDFLRQGNFKDTLQSSHPGILTMWLVGGMQQLGQMLAESNYFNSPFVEQMQWEIISLAFVISLITVLTYFLLARLFDPFSAAFASFLIALDPFHITISKTIHVDALMSGLLLASALSLLVWVRQKEQTSWRYLLLSGALGGLAVLTKLPAIFIFPYFLLVVVGYLGFKASEGEDRFFAVDVWRGIAWTSVKAGVIWLAVLVAVFVLLAPSMWVAPLHTLSILWDGVFEHTQNAHKNPMLFMGQIFVDDPGIWFYPVNVLLKMSEAMFVGLVLGVVALFRRGLKRPFRLKFLYLLAFFLFFLIQMTLGAKKSDRYILPAYQALLMFAGVGTICFLQTIKQFKPNTVYGLAVFVILFQASITLPRHPYYGTHYNLFLGTARVALAHDIVAGQEQGEGLAIMARQLNALPNAPLLTVGTQINESFWPYFDGRTTTILEEDADYLVFTRNWTERGMNDWEWREMWDRYQVMEPKYVVEFDGVPYVWAYKTVPGPHEIAAVEMVNVFLGDSIELLGYTFEPETINPGDPILLTLYWKLAEDWTSSVLNENDFTVFTHFIDGADVLYGQHDSPPNEGLYPTYLWAKGEIIKDQHMIVVDPETPPGSYQFAVGMYSPHTLLRLPIIESSGAAFVDGRIFLPGPLILP